MSLFDIHPLSSRPRRNRKSFAIRELVRENTLEPRQLILPIFVLPDSAAQVPIASLPGISRLGLKEILKEVESALAHGIYSVILFPCVPDSMKDQTASYSWVSDNFYLQTIHTIKQQFPEICVITDVAMDPYSSDGHDGYVENGEIVNDKTLAILARMGLAQAEAGADMLGPSDMMDGRIGYLRDMLDKHGYQKTSILSYTAKYASSFYGPFRDALDSAPKSGDKKTYQMSFTNHVEALREMELDQSEGADMLMVKPALAYLDIIQTIKQNTYLPVVAYNVSGEYAMIKAAGQNGWIDPQRAMCECLMSIRRAGADAIITYFALEYAALYHRGITW